MLLAGCNTIAPYRNASFNAPLPVDAPAPAAQAAPRDTFAVDGRRGNPRVLMFLALSGGGSRAAYLSTATMLALQSLEPALGVDLLDQVDVISSVSGGSIAGAYYAASRDAALTDPSLIGRVWTLVRDSPQPLPGLSLDAAGHLVCNGPLPTDDRQQLRRRLDAVAPEHAADDLAAIVELCRSAEFPPWAPQAVRDAMQRDYLRLWIANWFWPANILRYWTTSFDRSDIMAQTLANNIFSHRGLAGLFEGELTLADLNPTRPYLIINSTDATSQQRDDGAMDAYPFGSVFTFTREDFAERLCSDADSYPLARAVMGSAAFPLVFASMTLQDFRPRQPGPCQAPHPIADPDKRYLHVFDGGNSDNLGLRSVKRALLQLEADGRLQQYDRVIVLLVDAFTTPRGAARDQPDPRSLISLLLDTNVSDAVDSLLQTNREDLIAEFEQSQLGDSRDCDPDLRQLPASLCRALDPRRLPRIKLKPDGFSSVPRRVLDLSDRMVFVHFGFENVESPRPDAPDAAQRHALRLKLDRIPTSFRLDPQDAALIDQEVHLVVTPDNACLQALAGLVRLTGPVDAKQIRAARRPCRNPDSDFSDDDEGPPPKDE